MLCEEGGYSSVRGWKYCWYFPCVPAAHVPHGLAADPQKRLAKGKHRALKLMWSLGCVNIGLHPRPLHLEVRQHRVTELCPGASGLAGSLRCTVLSALLFHLTRKHLYWLQRLMLKFGWQAMGSKENWLWASSGQIHFLRKSSTCRLVDKPQSIILQEILNSDTGCLTNRCCSKRKGSFGTVSSIVRAPGK